MELDMQYIDKWSLWLDVKILVQTGTRRAACEPEQPSPLSLNVETVRWTTPRLRFHHLTLLRNRLVTYLVIDASTLNANRSCFLRDLSL